LLDGKLFDHHSHVKRRLLLAAGGAAPGPHINCDLGCEGVGDNEAAYVAAVGAHERVVLEAVLLCGLEPL